MFELSILGAMLMMFRRAYKLKTDKNYRNSVINHRSNEISENGELYTGFRRFKSVDGYIKYQYEGLRAWGILAILYIFISIPMYIMLIDPNIKYVAFGVVMIVTDYTLYKRNKNV